MNQRKCKVAFGVITITGRELYLERTLRSLGAPFRVLKDMGDTRLSLSLKRRRGAFIAALKALFKPVVDYALLVEDDILATKNIDKAAELIATYTSVPLISFYWGGPTRQEKKFAFIKKDYRGGTVAILIRKDMFNAFSSVANEGWYKNIKEGTGQILFQFAQFIFGGIPVTIPSLVQHVGFESSLGEENYTYMKRLGKVYQRRSPCFPGVFFDAERHYKYLEDRSP